MALKYARGLWRAAYTCFGEDYLTTLISPSNLIQM